MTKLVNKDAERLNPCLKEQEMSYQCLNKNGYDHEKCTDYFDNYNTCKKFWMGNNPEWSYSLRKPKMDITWQKSKHGKIYNMRKAKGQYPYLPEVQDRARIKEEYFQSVKNN